MRPRRIAVLASSQAMVLDAYYAETFVILLRGNITSFKVKNVTPGRKYVFIVKTDPVGGHEIKWGAQWKDATSIFAEPDSTTVLCFVAITGGLMLANAPGAWAA